MNPKKTTAIILAAGESSRMNAFKPLLKLGKTVILEHSVRLFRQSGVNDIRVVVGYRGDELIPLLNKLEVKPCLNNNYESGMLSSLKCGLRDIRYGQKAFFILPADIPLIRQQTVADLLSAFKADRKEILYPVFRNKRGHPPLVDIAYAPQIVGWPVQGNPRQFFTQYNFNARDLPVADRYIHMDADTPEDYQKLVKAYNRRDIPTIGECMALLVKKFNVKTRIVSHSREVAKLSFLMAQALQGSGQPMNTDLIVAAALLHDLARGRDDHAAVGAAILRDMNYPAVADIVAAHTDISAPLEGAIKAPEIVYLADKLVEKDQIVTLDEKFEKKMERYEGDSVALEAVKRRFANAITIRDRLEAAVGKPLDQISEASCSTEGDEVFAALVNTQ